jgi:hypothetical protein
MYVFVKFEKMLNEAWSIIQTRRKRTRSRAENLKSIKHIISGKMTYILKYVDYIHEITLLL